MSGGMPVPVSRDLDHHVAARRHDLHAALDRLLGDDVLGPDAQAPAVRHGVARVDREVDDDLLELALVDAHRLQVAAMHHGELDVLADQPAQQVRDFRQHVGHLQHARLQGLLAREGEQLAHQVGGAVGVLLDLHDVGERLVAGAVAQQQQVAEADHRGQQVVEIVRDAAGQQADRLHLLRLRELRLQALLLGRVDQMQDEADGVALVLAPRGIDDHAGLALAFQPHGDRQARRGQAPPPGADAPPPAADPPSPPAARARRRPATGSPNRLVKAEFSCSILRSASSSRMLVGASSKKRWKYCSDACSARSNSRSRVRSWTIERVRMPALPLSDRRPAR